MRHMAEDTQAIIVDYQEKLMPVMYEKEQLEKNSVILIKGLKALGSSDDIDTAVYKRDRHDDSFNFRGGRNRKLYG